MSPGETQWPLAASFLGPGHTAFQKQVRDVLGRMIAPHAADWDTLGHIPPQGWAALGGEGLLSLGHQGAGFLRSAIFLEELGAVGYAGVRAAIAVHAYMAASYLSLFGTRAQQDTFLPRVHRGEWIAALAITEADAGSDLRLLRTRARPQADGSFLLTGEKHYVTNGSQAGFFVVLARTKEPSPGRGKRGLTGASLLVIDASSPGIGRQPQPMIGWHAADVCRVTFTDVLVPGEHLVGRPGFGLIHLTRALDFERLIAGMLAVGGTRFCLDLLHRFVREHHIHDAPLSANQAIRHQIAELDSEFELTRHYAYHAAWLHSQGQLGNRTASILKLRATQLAVTAAQACVQLHGARGCLGDSAPARLYSDSVAGTIAGGASELMREMIFESSPVAAESPRRHRADLPGQTG